MSSNKPAASVEETYAFMEFLSSAVEFISFYVAKGSQEEQDRLMDEWDRRILSLMADTSGTRVSGKALRETTWAYIQELMGTAPPAKAAKQGFLDG